VTDVKALTITQPWATLIQRGAKRLETRSWYTNYRGALVIHAAKSFPLDCQDLLRMPPFYNGVGCVSAKELPRGVGLCVCILRACVKVSELHKLKIFDFTPSVDELTFGDFSDGRYAWLLEHQYDFVAPIPAKGALGLWPWIKDERPSEFEEPQIVCTACGSSKKLSLSKLGCYLCAKCRSALETASL
jgi:activating signal cointegrator 1